MLVVLTVNEFVGCGVVAHLNRTSDEGLTVEMSVLKLFTVANLHYCNQLS